MSSSGVPDYRNLAYRYFARSTAGVSLVAVNLIIECSNVWK